MPPNSSQLKFDFKRQQRIFFKKKYYTTEKKIFKIRENLSK